MNKIALILLLSLFSIAAQAISPLNVKSFYLSTDSGLLIGTNCYSVDFHLNGVDPTYNQGWMSCGTWTTAATAPVIGIGIPFPQLVVVGYGTYYDCLWLSDEFTSNPAGNQMNMECRSASPDNPPMFKDGFEPIK